MTNGLKTALLLGLLSGLLLVMASWQAAPTAS